MFLVHYEPLKILAHLILTILVIRWSYNFLKINMTLLRSKLFDNIKFLNIVYEALTNLPSSLPTFISPILHLSMLISLPSSFPTLSTITTLLNCTFQPRWTFHSCLNMTLSHTLYIVHLCVLIIYNTLLPDIFVFTPLPSTNSC